MEALSRDDIVYPDSDGRPLADNTAQYRWIVMLKENIEALLPDDFVAADLLWYPIRGDNETRIAPDVLVAQGRPKGERGSYRQWEEGGVSPQFVVEVLSPSNKPGEMAEKHAFYERHGVEEYLVIDPDLNQPENAILEVFVRRRGALALASFQGAWKSKLLGISLAREGERLVVRRPDGAPFLSFVELMAQRDAAQAQRDTLASKLDAANAELRNADTRRAAAQSERDEAQAERDAAVERAHRLAEKLRALGIDPDEG